MPMQDDDIQNSMGWREGYQSPNVPAQEPIVPTVPIREAGGSVVPAPDTSGLYAIYGRKNPYTRKADLLRSAATQPSQGINFAAPIAAYLAGKAEKKAAEFEAQKESDIQDFMERKKAYDAIKNDRETRQANAKYLTDTVFPAAQQEYANVLRETKDDKAASAAAAKVANQMAADQGIPTPEVIAFNAWKGATTFAVRNQQGKLSTAIYKDGAMKVQDEKGNFVTPDEKWLSVKDLSDLMDAEAKAQRSMSSGLKGKEHIYLTAKGEVLHSTDPDAAKKQGAVKVMMDVTDEDGIKSTKEFYLPGMAPNAETPPAQTKTPAPTPNPSAPIPVAGGGMAGFVNKPPANTQPQGELIRRKTKDGKIALYDQNKIFVRYE